MKALFAILSSSKVILCFGKAKIRLLEMNDDYEENE